jgi:hypothetical protein
MFWFDIVLDIGNRVDHIEGKFFVIYLDDFLTFSSEIAVRESVGQNVPEYANEKMRRFKQAYPDQPTTRDLGGRDDFWSFGAAAVGSE